MVVDKYVFLKKIHNCEVNLRSDELAVEISPSVKTHLKRLF